MAKITAFTSRYDYESVERQSIVTLVRACGGSVSVRPEHALDNEYFELWWEKNVRTGETTFRVRDTRPDKALDPQFKSLNMACGYTFDGDEENQ